MEQVMTAAEHLNAAYEGEIDKVVEEMLERSRENYAQIEALALECSAALTSAKAKANGLSEQSLFQRLWNSVTGRNERLRKAIEEDRAAAHYAMQQTINSVLKECTQNRLLALAVKSKLENEIVDQRSPDADATEDGFFAEEEEAAEIAAESELSESADASEELEAMWIRGDAQ